MFLEPRLQNIQHKKGWIEVICGSMFSGKTEELIRRLNRARIANLNVEIYKSAIDTRYHETEIVSHNLNKVSSTPVSSSMNILLMTRDADVIGIDEAQFFDEEIIYVCETLAQKGVRIIVAGLDMDYLGKPFGPMPALLSIAEFVTRSMQYVWYAVILLRIHSENRQPVRLYFLAKKIHMKQDAGDVSMRV